MATRSVKSTTSKQYVTQMTSRASVSFPAVAPNEAEYGAAGVEAAVFWRGTWTSLSRWYLLLSALSGSFGIFRAEKKSTKGQFYTRLECQRKPKFFTCKTSKFKVSCVLTWVDLLCICYWYQYHTPFFQCNFVSIQIVIVAIPWCKNEEMHVGHCTSCQVMVT